MDFEAVAQDFKTASDELGRPVTLEEVANECGVSVECLRRSMLHEGSEDYLPPPRFWKGDLASLARERAAELVELADELEASAWAPATKEELEEIGSMILTRFDQIIQRADGLEDFEKRREDFERRQADIEKRRSDRKERREGKLAELNEMFLRGILRSR